MFDVTSLRLRLTPRALLFLQPHALDGAAPELPSGNLLVEPARFARALRVTVDTYSLTPGLLNQVARAGGEHRYAVALGDPDLAAADTDIFAAWLGPANPLVAGDLVLAWQRPDAPANPELDMFMLRPDPRRRYLLPRAALGSLTPPGAPSKVTGLSRVFTTQEEAETTLSLWAPGGDDMWADFAYAHRTARAL